jgi:hypothetical protein
MMVLKCTAVKAPITNKLETRILGSSSFFDEPEDDGTFNVVCSCLGANDTAVLSADPTSSGAEKNAMYGQIYNIWGR